ncbi:MAG: aminopeptidase [Flavobacteriaceae bacterium]|nr:aminopeptidase [Flavobacteriaceae bacterium]
MNIKTPNFLLLAFLLFGMAGFSQETHQSILEKLKQIPLVTAVSENNKTSHFNANFELWFTQPIDYSDLNKGTFKQRVLIGHTNSEKPVIVELQGYGIYTNKAGELAQHYLANQITIEHRYFNNSRPEKIIWKTLTIENAAKDQERIISAIRKAIYPTAKFVTTGISKGCQTTMAHRRFFPNNVDASVCYVGPLNFKRVDPRVFQFLNTVGNETEREQLQAFQTLCFENREALLKQLKKVASANNYTWEFGVEKALDYSILEYSFAFWQWGSSFDSIPSQNASVDKIYKHLMTISGYSFFEENGVKDLQPYFWAALTQQGIYAYETNPFKKYLNTEELYTFDWAFPEGINIEFDEKPMQEIDYFLNNFAHKILFIYGEKDAWSSTAVQLRNDPKQREMYKFVHKNGSHKTRINSFNKKEQQNIYTIIDAWVK